jgi:hypothetical protein
MSNVLTGLDDMLITGGLGGDGEQTSIYQPKYDWRLPKDELL